MGSSKDRYRNSEKKKVNEGDIVNFYSSNRVWLSDYKGRNPGIVIANQEKVGTRYYDKGHAYILWADGSMTREHHTYLEVVSNE